MASTPQFLWEIILKLLVLAAVIGIPGVLVRALILKHLAAILLRLTSSVPDPCCVTHYLSECSDSQSTP